MNWIDYLILAVLLISMIVGLKRGLVREVLSLITLIAAFVVAILFADSLSQVFSGSQAAQHVADQIASNTASINPAQPISYAALGISYILLFIGTIIVGTFITYLVSYAVESGGISFSNRFLGALFGLCRGFLLIVVVLFLVELSPFAEASSLAHSKLVVSFQPAVTLLSTHVSPSLANLKEKIGKTMEEVNTP